MLCYEQTVGRTSEVTNLYIFGRYSVGVFSQIVFHRLVVMGTQCSISV